MGSNLPRQGPRRAILNPIRYARTFGFAAPFWFPKVDRQISDQEAPIRGLRYAADLLVLFLRHTHRDLLLLVGEDEGGVGGGKVLRGHLSLWSRCDIWDERTNGVGRK